MLKHQGLIYFELEYYDIVIGAVICLSLRMLCPHGVVIGWKFCLKNLAMLGVCHHGIVDISFSVAMTLA